jgi:hypothetical protein
MWSVNLSSIPQLVTSKMNLVQMKISSCLHFAQTEHQLLLMTRSQIQTASNLNS